MWPFSSLKVLIVSEETSEPVLHSAFLHQPNIRLLSSFPDADGLKLARKKRLALIVEHVCSRAGQGLDFCHELRADPRTRKIPLIVVAETDLHGKVAAIRAEALLKKPLDRREYFDAVRRFLPMPERSSERTTVNLRFRYKVEDGYAQAFSRDISLSGAFIKSDSPLTLGTRLHVEFNIPGNRESVRCAAVVRSGPLRDEGFGPGGFGVEFEGMTQDDTERLEQFIECCNRHHRS